MRAARGAAWCVLAIAAVSGTSAAAQTLDRREAERLERTLRQEGEAVLAIAADAAAGRELPADFTLRWHNDYLKAHTGTFVPFIVSLADAGASAVLLYVRVAVADDRDSVAPASYAFEDVYPVELSPGPADVTRVSRGFAVPAGEYEVVVVARERERAGARGRRRAAALRQRLSIPDFAMSRLTTSSVMLGDRLETLRDGDTPDLSERPYVLGNREFSRAVDGVFGQDQELVVLLLIYHPTRTADEHFDLEVEYHFFRRVEEGPGPPGMAPGSPAVPAVAAGERYFNRTDPQRFNPLVLGRFTPAAGQPILAGQGVPLAGFEHGDYRLAIVVTDLVSGQRIERQVLFTVG